jgi:hypothetical protein
MQVLLLLDLLDEMDETHFHLLEVLVEHDDLRQEDLSIMSYTLSKEYLPYLPLHHEHYSSLLLYTELCHQVVVAEVGHDYDEGREGMVDDPVVVGE